MIAELVTLSNPIFWAVLALVIVIDLFSFHHDEFNPAMIVTSVWFTLVFLFTDAFVDLKPGVFLIGLGLYFVAGVVWSIWKWYGYILKKREQVVKWYEENVNKELPGNETFESFSSSRRPLASKNKTRIVSWMVLWPFSVTWWLLTWPRRMFSWLYERLSTIFDRIGDWAWNR